MKRKSITVTAFSVIAMLSLLLLESCNGKSGYFKLEGRLLHINRGELYVYSPEETTKGLDTIPIEGGRFTYEMPCDKDMTLVLVFRNLSEQPVFAASGEQVDIKADVTNLKEMEVEGTEANELMTEFRKQTAHMSPPDIAKEVETFIDKHPDSPVGVWLLRKYYVQSSNPDCPKATSLAARMLQLQDKNGYLKRLHRHLVSQQGAMQGSSIASFSARDIVAQRDVSARDVNRGVAVINVWASWNYEGLEMQRMLNRLKKQHGDRLSVLGICVDADPDECRRILHRDTIGWKNVCDGRMMETPLLQKIGLSDIPDNLILHDGRIVARGLNLTDMQNTLRRLIGGGS